MKKSVLFVCTHNSARSQMAEAFLRYFFGDAYEALSAGIEPTGLHPLAIKVMAEIGIDIRCQKSKSIEEFLNREIDLVVTVCDLAREKCPYFPLGKRKIHISFPDPALEEASEEKKLEKFRQVRDQIRDWILKNFTPLSHQETEPIE